MRVISLGWGVQSFALAAMSALGELPPVDAAIHADTTHERMETYEFAARWTPWLEERGVRVVTVRAPDNRLQGLQNTECVSVLPPAFGTWPGGLPSGQIRRQCTYDWKIAPQRRWMQAHRNGEQVVQWLGITLDEWQRMRDSDVKYITYVYPFMDMAQPWRRGDVLRWLMKNGLEIPLKSRCVFCPFQRDADWRECKLADNNDWERAVNVDRLLRHKVDNYILYVHRNCEPLESVDFRNEQDHGQLTLWDEEECTGMCFL